MNFRLFLYSDAFSEYISIIFEIFSSNLHTILNLFPLLSNITEMIFFSSSSFNFFPFVFVSAVAAMIVVATFVVESFAVQIDFDS